MEFNLASAISLSLFLSSTVLTWLRSSKLLMAEVDKKSFLTLFQLFWDEEGGVKDSGRLGVIVPALVPGNGV